MIFLAYLLALGALSAKHVEISLESRWPCTHADLEVCEFYRRNHPDKFWQFLERASAESALDGCLGDCGDVDSRERCIATLATLSSDLISNSSLKMMAVLVRTRYYTAAVQSMLNIAPETDLNSQCFVELDDGVLITNPDQIEDAIKRDYSTTDRHLVPNVDIPYIDVGPEANRTIILYCRPGPSMLAFHRAITAKLTDECPMQYSFRYSAGRVVRNGLSSFLCVCVKVDQSRDVLYGYAAELQIKSTEYTARDDSAFETPMDNSTDEGSVHGVQGFDFATLTESFPHLNESLRRFKDHLLDDGSILQLKPWEMQSLSLQIASLIINSSDPMHAFTEYSQNFLLHVRAISSIQVLPEYRERLKQAERAYEHTFGIHPSHTQYQHRLLVNGRVYDNSLDLFTFLEFILEEQSLVEAVAKAIYGNVDPGDKYKLALRILNEVRNEDIAFASSASSLVLDFRDKSIVWLNDIEKEERYHYWSRQLINVLLNVPFIRRNMYHFVLYLSMGSAEREQSKAIVRLIEELMEKNYPLTFGVVVVPDDPFGTSTQAPQDRSHVNCVLQHLDRDKRLRFLSSLLDRPTSNREIITSLIGGKRASKIVDECVGRTEEGVSAYFARTGIDSLPTVLFNGIRMDASEINEEQVRKHYINEQRKMAMLIEDGSKARPRINYDLYPRVWNRLSLEQSEQLIDNSLSVQYFHKQSQLKDSTHEDCDATIMLIVNLESEHGRNSVLSALNYSKVTENVRLSIIPNPSETHLNPKSFSLTFEALTKSKLSMSSQRRFLAKYLPGDANDFPLVAGIDPTKIITDEVSLRQSLQTRQHRVLKTLKGMLRPGQTGLVANGVLIGPITKHFIMVDDIDFVYRQVKPFAALIASHLHRTPDTPQPISNTIFKLGAIFSSHKQVSRIDVPQSNKHAIVSGNVASSLRVHAFVDPATETAQALAPILNYLKDVLSTTLYLLCTPMLSDLPIKRLYRDSISSTHAVIRFENVPLTQLFSLNIITPQAWMVAPLKARYDMDNIRLVEVSSAAGIDAKFQLEYILVEGQCFDKQKDTPAKGVELTLTKRGQHQANTVFDTIVMANLGYFQLKSFPGRWDLQIRPNTNSSLLYKLDKPISIDFDTFNTAYCSRVEDSLEARMVANEPLIKEGGKGVDDTKDGGMWSLIANMGKQAFMRGRKHEETLAKTEPVVNIFSIASGHLYERFLRIMMLSVRTQTKRSRVKFWFLKNFLSPQFLNFLPHYAKAYDFDYELVQYKWPRWLTVYPKQKQRVIWGYKILFLDVLFPLNVSRIIFVDADQVVRADMTELNEMHLKGAPYGYTPFCDSRKEMDGYRFWRHGYWANHLGHRKYHISALYVVDLDRFRKVLAGDRLRGQYFSLSSDPNSLQNLDQDLPNNMVHQVDIFSLPQEWLWCETWCDDASKARAKTIDLCNNPMTKEPKLKSARRIIAEWDQYDSEISHFMDFVSKGGHAEQWTNHADAGIPQQKHKEL